MKFHSQNPIHLLLRQCVDRNRRWHQRRDFFNATLGQQHRFHWKITFQQPSENEFAFRDEKFSGAIQFAILQIAVEGDARIVEGADVDDGVMSAQACMSLLPLPVIRERVG